MKKDIETKEDIQHLIQAFYAKVTADKTLGFFFTEVAKVNWEKHLPVMYSFWETLLLGESTYKGNPMVKHLALNQKESMKPAHFNRWIELWEANLDEHFEGSKAEEAKSSAKAMQQLMMLKIDRSDKPNFIQ